MKTRRNAASVTLPSVVLALLLAGPAFAEDDETSLDDLPHITIIGTAESQVAPDLAIVTLAVSTEKPTATAAADETARKARAVIDAAKAQGIAQTDIATQSVTLAQTFDDVRDKDGNVKRESRGFEADNTIAIKVRDLSKAGTIAGSLIAKGANRFDGIAFVLEHPEPVMARLAGEAVKDARTQARSAADAAGVRLGRVLLIERPSEADAPRAAIMRRKVAEGPEMPIEPGKLSLRATMEVTWSIDPQ